MSHQGLPCEDCEEGLSWCCDDDTTIGELFAGYGGLGMGVQAAIGGTISWVSEFDDAPSRILAHRLPGVPNYGDITKIQWLPFCPVCPELTLTITRTGLGKATGYFCRECTCWYSFADVADQGCPIPVDVMTGGSPCQDLSNAGARKGMTEGTRSNLWVNMREGIALLRPRLVVWENVRGAYTTNATSQLESDPRLLDEVRRRDGEPVLRALGRVLGDLSDLGYDARWHGLRAADVGAPHNRFRVFVVAAPAHPGSKERNCWPGLRPARARLGRGRPDHGRREDVEGELNLPTPSARDYKDHTIRREPHRPDDIDTLARALADVPAAGDRERLFPTPRPADGPKGSPGQRGSSGDQMLAGAALALFPTTPEATAASKLLPTPAVNDMGAAYTPEQWDAWTDEMKAKHGNGNGHGDSLNVEVQRLLPTPQAHDAKGPKTKEQIDAMRADGHGVANLNEGVLYDLPAPSIAPYEQRLLPTPTTTDANGAGAPEDNAYRGTSLTDATARQPHKWGAYAAAVARWEGVSGVVAPAPTAIAPSGTVRLAAEFSEWMMGLPPGWVTDPDLWIGLTNKKGKLLHGSQLINAARNHQLKALGNGVVPAQAEAALRLLLDPDLLNHPLPAPAVIDDGEPEESW